MEVKISGKGLTAGRFNKTATTKEKDSFSIHNHVPLDSKVFFLLFVFLSAFVLYSSIPLL